jgi:hypothetical protein
MILCTYHIILFTKAAGSSDHAQLFLSDKEEASVQMRQDINYMFLVSSQHKTFESNAAQMCRCTCWQFLTFHICHKNSPETEEGKINSTFIWFRKPKFLKYLDILYAFSLYVLVLISHDMHVYYNHIFNEQGGKEIIQTVKCQFRGPGFKTTFL